jgi:hypothetical protein
LLPSIDDCSYYVPDKRLNGASYAFSVNTEPEGGLRRNSSIHLLETCLRSVLDFILPTGQHHKKLHDGATEMSNEMSDDNQKNAESVSNQRPELTPEDLAELGMTSEEWASWTTQMNKTLSQLGEMIEKLEALPPAVVNPEPETGTAKSWAELEKEIMADTPEGQQRREAIDRLWKEAKARAAANPQLQQRREDFNKQMAAMKDKWLISLRNRRRRGRRETESGDPRLFVYTKGLSIPRCRFSN